MKEFLELFDLKRFKLVLRLILLVALLVFTVNVIGVAYSRYSSEGEVETSAKVAYFVAVAGTETKSLSLDGLLPRSEPYLYKIQVNNFDEAGNKSNVDLKYKVTFKTTTNLPLEIHLIRNQEFTNNFTDIISRHTYSTDDGMVWSNYELNQEYTFLKDTKHTDEYTLIVYFPTQYQNMPDKYQGLIDLIDVTVTSEQLV